MRAADRDRVLAFSRTRSPAEIADLVGAPIAEVARVIEEASACALRARTRSAAPVRAAVAATSPEATATASAPRAPDAPAAAPAPPTTPTRETAARRVTLAADLEALALALEDAATTARRIAKRAKS